MNHKFFSSIIFILASSALLEAQKIDIQWEAPKEYDLGDQKLLLPHFKNEGFSFSQNNIFIEIKQKSNGKQFKIDQHNWEKVADKDLHALLKYSLPDRNIQDIKYIQNDQEEVARINVALFKVENNAVYRLTSFNISEGAPYSSRGNASQKLGTTNNPLSSGNFYKVKVDKSGIFKITYEFLQQNGLNPNTINPRNLRVYGNGGVMLPEYNQDPRYDALQENAISFVGADDGKWDPGDYALFYAQGPTGYNLYNGGNGNGFKRTETRIDNPEHLKNIYDDYSYYFINFDKGLGKRIENEDADLLGQNITTYDDYQYVNNDKVNLLKVGRTWVDDEYFIANKTVTFTLPSSIAAGTNVRYRTRLIAYGAQGNQLGFNINNVNAQTTPIPTNSGSADFSYYPIRYNGVSTNISGNSVSFNYSPNITSNPNGQFYLDYAEVQYRLNLRYNGSQMNFRDYSINSGSALDYHFSVGNSGGLEQVWDVTDPTNAKKKVNKSNIPGTFAFGYKALNTDFNNEFVAFKHDAAYTPTFVGKIDNQNLSALQNVDYLIVTTPEMTGQAKRLETYHESTGLKVEIVDINKIYNEYSSGSQDATAIRDFITKLKSNANPLKYVLFLGDTSYDFKNRIQGNTNIVLSYQSEQSENLVSSFVTDDYFVMTEPQTVTSVVINKPDLPIGRLPAANLTEASSLVSKTLSYYNAQPGQSTPFGEWRMKLDFVADDDKDNNTPFHNIMEASLASEFEGTTDKPEYNIRKLYLDSFPAQNTAGGQRFPQVNQAISNDVGNSLFMFYFGHGSINGWAQERVLTSTEVQNFYNYSNVYSRFPLMSTITCEFALWDDPHTNSVGEQVIKHKQGGSATMITSSRKVAVNYGEDFTGHLVKHLFQLNNDDFETLGDSFLRAKRTYVGGSSQDFVKVNYLGDPAMKLSRPKRQITIDNIETPVTGLIRALDFVKIKGRVTNPNGTVNTSFNGRVAINIFDKPINKSTLNNDGDLTPVLNYKEENGPIVKASGQVVNGIFTVEFYVPNDINYTIGEGRILAYADNKAFDVFNNQKYNIGDINPNGINDTEPPKVKLYMNNTNFANGGITDQNPMLLACVSDDTGINSTGAGVGHDIITYLDGEIINTIVLNDFYGSGDGNGCINPSLQDYQKGYVTYPFRNLAPGDHILTFKVWDINNNSTTETLKFTVKDEADEKLIINRPLNWPNPFTNKTYIQFEHNCDDILDVNVQIYTITGKLVKTISTTVIAEPFLQGYRTPRQAIEWDGRDDFGDTVGKGTYIFKIFARSQNQEKCKGGATALEKMVLLK